MNVLLLSNLFPTSKDQTRGVFVAQLARSIAKSCHIHALVPLPWVPDNRLVERFVPADSRSLVGVDAEMNWGGVAASYVRYPMIPKISRFWHPQFLLMGAAQKARELHKRYSFDVVNAHWLDPDGVAAASIARELHIPLVLSARGCDVNLYLQDQRRRERILRALSSAQAVTTVSAALKEVLVREGVDPSGISVIANGVDDLRFFLRDRGECRRALGISEHRPLIVCISRLSDEKGVDVLLRAVSLMGQGLGGAQVAVVGAGPLQETLNSLVESLGIRDAVRFVGAVPHEQVAIWLGAADLSCMPSLREGYPNAAMEALACGRPVIASRVGALPEMISGESGILVEPGNPQALADALTKAMSVSWSAEAIAHSVEGASWDSAAKLYMGVYESAIHATPHRVTRA